MSTRRQWRGLKPFVPGSSRRDRRARLAGRAGARLGGARAGAGPVNQPGSNSGRRPSCGSRPSHASECFRCHCSQQSSSLRYRERRRRDRLPAVLPRRRGHAHRTILIRHGGPRRGVGPYPYPPLPALLAMPLTPSLQAAGRVVMVLLDRVAFAVPFVLGVRDWRCYGVLLLAAGDLCRSNRKPHPLARARGRARLALPRPNAPGCGGHRTHARGEVLPVATRRLASGDTPRAERGGRVVAGAIGALRLVGRDRVRGPRRLSAPPEESWRSSSARTRTPSTSSASTSGSPSPLPASSGSASASASSDLSSCWPSG